MNNIKNNYSEMQETELNVDEKYFKIFQNELDDILGNNNINNINNISKQNNYSVKKKISKNNKNITKDNLKFRKKILKNNKKTTTLNLNDDILESKDIEAIKMLIYYINK